MMKRFKTIIAILLTFAMILTGGSALSVLDASAEAGSSGTEKQVTENGDVSDAQAENTDDSSAVNQTDDTSSDQAGNSSEEYSSDAQDEIYAEETGNEDQQREIKVKLKRDALFEKPEEENDSDEKIMTEAYTSLNDFWDALSSRDAVVSAKKTGFKITVSGNLPKGVTAEAGYIRAGNTNAFSEQGMLTFRLTLLDENGEVYIPEEPVNISIEGKGLEKKIEDQDALLVYSYEAAPERAEQLKEEFEKPFYTADVRVSESENVNEEILQYEVYDKEKEYKDGEDAVRFFDDKYYLAVGEDAVSFEYDFNTSFGEGSERYKANEDGTDAQAGSPVFVLTSQMTERTLKATAGGADITVTGPLDEDVTLKASEVTKKNKAYDSLVDSAAKKLDTDAEDISTFRAFDIKLVDSKTGKEFDPDNKVKVSIDLGDEKIDKDKELSIVHFKDEKDKKPELMKADTEGVTVEFETGNFSIFAVVGDDGKLYDEDGNRIYIRTYRFFTQNSTGDYVEYAIPTEYGSTTATQRIKNGEKPVAPLIPTDPMEKGGTFIGWFEDVGEGDDPVLADKPYDFDNIPKITTDEELHLYAKFSRRASVVFHEQYDSKTEDFPVTATRNVEMDSEGGSGHDSGTINIKDVAAKYYDSSNSSTPGMEFAGWSYTSIKTPGSPVDDEGNPVSIISDDEITVSEETHLYPVFRSVKWLIFNSGPAGSGATYYSPKSFPEGGEFTSLGEYVPERDGYDFDGWWTGTPDSSQESGVAYSVQIAGTNGSLIAGARDTEAGVEVTGGKLMVTGSSATLYAKWTYNPDKPIPPRPEIWYLVKIDTNGGALYTYDDTETVLTGTGSTWFWPQSGERVEEYTNVTRDYVPSASGDYYFVNRDREYYGFSDEYDPEEGNARDRQTYYTTKMSEATSLDTYKYSPGTYKYAGWYEVDKETGQETLYDFGKTVDHDLTLKLHWKKAGQYYIEYDPVMRRDGKTVEGTMDEGSEDTNGYADKASVQLTRNAIAPEGYEFIGWSVRGDDSGRIYRTDEAVELPAEYAVTVNNKEKVFFEAVYSKASSAKMIFDANGGTLKDGLPSDFQYIETDYIVKPVFSVGADNKTVQADQIINNGIYKLSETQFFTREGCEFTGWNTEADGSGKHYDAGTNYGIDSNEPVKLYAEWKIRVYFDKNGSDADWNESAWGTPNDDGYIDADGRQYYADNGRYYILVNIDAPISEPLIKPANEGTSFKYWSASSDPDAEAFDFGNTDITEETTLYAHWTESALVPLHVFTYDPSNMDADAVDRDSWRKTSEVEITSENSKTVSDICSEYLRIPEEYADGYEYVYAYTGTEIDKTKPAGGDPVTELEAGDSGQITIKYQSGATQTLQDGQGLYLVYAPKTTEKTVNINYVKQTSGGGLQNVEGAAAGVITYNSGEMTLNEAFVPDILNDATVSQSQTLKVTTKDLVISQSSTKNFNMPSRLDDGTKELELIYSRIGTGNSGATSLDSLDSDTDKKLHLQIRDGKLMWSYDGQTWQKFGEEEGYTPTVYAVYKERGHELKITKKVTQDTGVRDYKKFKVTLTSLAITEESYSVEGTGYSTVEATPAHGDTPGSIELSVKHGSEIVISGLAEGSYTIAETDNANYELKARTGPLNGDLTETNVTDNTTLDPMTLDKDMEAELSNNPEYICRIEYPENSGTYEAFFTLNSALEFANDPGTLDGKAKIEMLVDYVMPAKDALYIDGGNDIELTTATDGSFDGAGQYAVITRDNDFTRGPMFNNEGALTFRGIVLDGKNTEISSEMVHSASEVIEGDEKHGLYIESDATFKNANNTGNGGAINISKGKVYVSGGSFENNSAVKGGAIYVSEGDVEITGGTIGISGKGNHAEKGGAVYYEGGGTIKVSGGTISHNAADTSGGAIYAANGTLEITGGNISNNTASGGNGGAVFAESAIINISGNQTSISSNTAKSGGAIYFDQSGTLTMSGGQINNNTASDSNGGAIVLSEGTADFTGGTMTGNSAANGNGGAIYAGSAIVTITKGTFSSNTAQNGSAVYIDNGTGKFSGGSITGNISTQGGAVGVGSDSAKLEFSGSPQIKNNPIGTAGSGNYANVYLDQDTDVVISNTGNLGNSAYIGIYVPGSFDSDLFKNRGEAGALFGTFTPTYNDKATIAAFKNDRLDSLSAIALANSKNMMWGKAVSVEVRYIASFTNNFLPDTVGSTVRYTNNTYYLPSSENSVSSVAEDLRENYSINLPTNTAMFAGAYIEGDQNYVDYYKYLTDVNWDNGTEDQTETSGWKGVRRYKVDGQFKKDDLTKLVIYYSEPAYISIENNTDYELDITSLNVYGHNAINGTAVNDAGYGYVYAVNGAIRDELLPVTADDLKLEKMKSIKLVFPGACGKSYEMTGSYINVPGGTDIPVRIGGTSYGSVPQGKYSSFTLGTSESADISSTPLLPSTSGGSVDIAFGGSKPICKIETDQVPVSAVTEADKVVARTDPDSSGKVQYCFATLNDAKNFAVRHTLKTTAIEMLVDYLIPSTDVLVIPAGYDITLKTAVGSGEGYYYEGDRATISRDSDNMESFITSAGGASTTFRIENLTFDGKSLGGNINGGVVKTSQCVVIINEAEFINCIANNGGGMYVERGNRNDVNVSVSNSTFENCRSKSTANRQGGGAIWTDVRRNTTVTDEEKQGLYIYNCEFTRCSAYDQGGAVFHRVDSDLDTMTTLDKCQFIGCEARAAGGMESGAKYVNLIDSTFRDCTATDRNGGGANFYSLNQANPSATCTVTATGCTFENCRATNLASGDRYGGGFRSTARNTYLTNCTFTNCSAKRGGGIGLSSTNAANAEIHGCVIDGCTATEYGGGIYMSVRTVVIDNVISDTGRRQTEIKNCTAGTYGGGIRHARNDASASLTVDHATISGNTSNGSGTNGNGGGVSIKDIRNATFTDSTLQKNTAKSGGGGIYMGSPGNDRRLTLDNTDVKENRSGDKGGGVYCDSQLTIRNGSMITKNAISTAADNAAGVYLLDGRTLTVGEAEDKTDSSSVINNATDGKTPSNIRLWSATTGEKLNNTASVYVNCDLSGRIGVLNASAKLTQFGSSRIQDPKGFGYADGTQVFRSDDETLFGVIDRGDPNGKKIIWRGDVICKITDESGHLLYLGDNDPAVFDALDVGDEGNRGKASAFSYLRNANPALYYKDGTPYTGNAYCVKMLESYVATKPIFTYVNKSRTITLTTAGRTDAEYPYRGKAGTPATVTRAASMANRGMITAGCTFKLQNIILDGGSKTGVVKNTATRILQTAGYENVARVTIGNKATLQNAHVSGNGGAVFATWAGNEVILDGGEIKNCTANNGGGIYKEGRSVVSIISGSISACAATTNGGGVYYEYKNESYNSHIFTMEGGSITKCSAVKGGGVFLANQVVMRMSGGNIRNNTVTGGGGGIAIDGNAVRLHFSGRVIITGNKLNGEANNVELSVGSTAVINTSGLDKKANIGVYVPGGNLYENYGVQGKPFGKYTGTANLARFINDRNGCKGGIKPEDPGTIYWIEGSRKVILRKIGKIGNENEYLPKGAYFTVYFDTEHTVATDMEGNRLVGLKSNDSGMFFAGEMYYGTYYIEETRAPGGYTKPAEGKYFVVTVSSNGVGYYDGDEYQKEIDAE